MTVSRFLSLLFLAAAPLTVCAGDIASGSGTSRWATFDDASHHLYALSLQPKEQLNYPRPSGYEVVVLFDTSASQTGWVRTEGIEVLNEFAASLPVGAKVGLVACDVEAVTMSTGLVAATDPAWESAVSKLKKRTPLGATDLAQALRTASKMFGSESSVQRTIVYIGDGINRQGFLTQPQQRELIGSLVNSRISISTFLIGPVVDIPTVASIVNQTGGVLYSRDAIQESTQVIGRNLGASVLTPVVWVEKAELPKSIETQLPQQFPPLRIDRDTVIVGKLKSTETANGKISVVGKVAGKSMNLSWDVAPESNPDLGFLVAVVERNQADGGLNLPALGSDGLRAMSYSIADSATDLVKSGGFALRSGQPASAKKIAEEALKQDPNNSEAIGLLNAANKALNPEDDSIPTGKLMQFGGNGDGGATIQSGSGDLLAKELELRKASSEAMEKDVRVQLRELRSLASKDPTVAKNQLKLLMERVDDSVELDGALKTQLRDQIGSQIQTVTVEESRFAQKAMQTETIRAQADAKQRALNETRRSEESLKHLVEHFNELMARQRYLEASKDVSPEIEKQAPNTVLAEVARDESSLLSNYSILRDAFERREQGVVDALRGVEEAAIPFDGTPSPVIYPAPEIWQALSARRKERYGSFNLSGGGDEKEQRLYAYLKQSADNSLSYQATPLSRVLQQLEDEFKMPTNTFWLNTADLETEGVDPDSPITMSLPPVSLRSALRLILKPLGLTYIIRNEVLEITTESAVDDGDGIPKVYPVGDLVVPPMSMGGGMMGGMGGGMGGMGGGMGGMGGGMGGMGGGMGGMGGGMMGGMGGGRGGMMAVADDSSKKPVSSSRDEMNPEAWVAKFEAAKEEEIKSLNKEISALVHRHVELAKAHVEAKQLDDARGEFQQIINLVNGLLSGGYPQPWMYQALSLSMDACNYPHAEIRRVLLSSLDFDNNSEQAMEIAQYMARKGMKSEALQLLRDLAVVQPLRYEIYSMALPLAKDTEELEHLRWVCAGIVSKAWPREYSSIYDQANVLAQATKLKLEQIGLKDEAKSFDEEIKNAKLRDLIVRVTWTGKADLDIRVQEPTGSVCSVTNPITLGGGVLVGDTSSLVEKPRLGGFSEYYVCAAGYAGQYDVLIRRVWGEVSGGKATVEIYTNFGTPEQKFISQEINIGEKAALVQVEVKNGHRQEPIADAQLAGIKAKQLATSRALLAQIGSTTTSESSPSSGGGSYDNEYYNSSRADYFAMRQNLIRNGGGFGFPGRGGVVGYQPVITTLPEGASLSVSGVVSADRRYVRISPQPFFSGIGEIFTYNSITGTTGAGGAGTGGFGGGGLGTGGGGGGGIF